MIITWNAVKKENTNKRKTEIRVSLSEILTIYKHKCKHKNIDKVSPNRNTYACKYETNVAISL